MGQNAAYTTADLDTMDLDRLFSRKGELKFRFVERDSGKAAAIGRIISIDRRKDSLYTAYANRAEFERFLSWGYDLSLLTDPAADPDDAKAGEIGMALTVEEMQDWDRYPSYPVYVDMMRNLAASYPHLCRLDTIGTSVEGRLILCLKISDHVEEEEAEPGFFYSSSIHGDELTGFVLMLRLADHLLRNYGTDPEATQLVDGLQIYINPLSNPDGAYALSDRTVAGATRYNANWVDLNRNYPDFWKGNSGTLQPENRAMIAYMQGLELTASVNIHGGSDVLNFPWDGFRSSAKKHADYDWWTRVSARYVDTCRKTDPSAYRDVNAAGYIHGGDWYVVHNGRQDYVNVYRHVREQTLEISVVKTPASSQLPSFWNINGRSLINYMKEAGYGLRGTVRDSVSGEFLRAMVTVEEHDKDSSQMYSSARHGMFFRPIAAGTYDLRFSAPGYRDKIVQGVSVSDFSATVCDVMLAPVPVLPPDTLPPVPDTLGNEYNKAVSAYRLYPNPALEEVTIEAAVPFSVRNVYDAAGRPVVWVGFFPETFSCRCTLPVSAWPSGLYFVEVSDRYGKTFRFKLLKGF